MGNYQYRQVYSYDALNGGKGIFLVLGTEPLEDGKAVLVATVRVPFIACHSIHCLDQSNVKLIGNELEGNMPDVSELYNTWSADCHRGCGVFTVPMATVEQVYLEAGAPPATALYPCDGGEYKANKTGSIFIPIAASDSPAPDPR